MADDDLVRVLSEIQRRGAIGRTPIVDAIAHADRFVALLPTPSADLASASTERPVVEADTAIEDDLAVRGAPAGPAPADAVEMHPGWSLADLGSGGGLPGLVIAVRRPDVRVTLIERRTKRVDLLRYGARALALRNVVVHDGDADGFAARPGFTMVDVVTARSFGPPLLVLATAASIIRPGGVVIISEPPLGLPRWSEPDVSALGFIDDGHHDGVRRFTRFHVEPPAP